MGKKRVLTEKNKETPVAPSLTLRKRKKKKWLMRVLIILIVVGLIYFFRVSILNGLKNIPVIEQFIPDILNEETLSIEELNLKVKSQEQEIERLKAENETLEASNTKLSIQNESLKQYEAMYTDFLAQKEAWDEEVAKTDTDLFIDQFESVYPDTAERIYKTLKGEKLLSDKQKALSKTIGEMDETQAAKALELLITTDSELIQIIFEGMNTDRKALILGEMTSDSAAQVIKLIAPDHQLID
ncbi:MAG: hypothetical protein H9872_02380 [Candidatus Cellulosilyticum pullistercoris]|uniref:Magnesium transporter MgtE intracellular domain-containing protein n=1 Tax=Candidatus Cellulosilyticum pullistercoris TaxID=2838521 RepID=A0A9E2KBJ4_9FIRM|nr:hypothetical protein [Candidatus Cellulosilyticum pullistercoris]